MRFVFHLAAKRRNLASKTILTQSSEKQTAVTKAMWGRGTSDLVISTIRGQKVEMILKPTSLTEPQWVIPTGTVPKVTTKISVLLSWLIKRNFFRRRNWGSKQSNSEEHSLLADKVKLVLWLLHHRRNIDITFPHHEKLLSEENWCGRTRSTKGRRVTVWSRTQRRKTRSWPPRPPPRWPPPAPPPPCCPPTASCPRPPSPPPPHPPLYPPKGEGSA